MAIAGGLEEYTALTRGAAPLPGTTVVVTGQWFDAQGDVAAVALSALGADLGIDVQYRQAGTIDPSVAATAAPRDIVLGAPVTVEDITNQPIVEIRKYLGEPYVRDSYGNYLASLGSVNGRVYGVLVALGAKSLIWYNAEAFEKEG